MKRIEIRPAWRFVDQDGGQLDPQLFTLLNALHETGKLTQAAARSSMSYRHAWNVIGKWADFFGSPLVNLEQGRGARLTSLGEKLLRARRALAGVCTRSLGGSDGFERCVSLVKLGPGETEQSSA